MRNEACETRTSMNPGADGGTYCVDWAIWLTYGERTAVA